MGTRQERRTANRHVAALEASDGPIQLMTNPSHVLQRIDTDLNDEKRLLLFQMPSSVTDALRHICRKAKHRPSKDWTAISKRKLLILKKHHDTKLNCIIEDPNKQTPLSPHPARVAAALQDKLEKIIRESLVKAGVSLSGEIDWRVGFLASNGDDCQDPHTDFELNRLKDAQQCGPHILEIPITQDGMKTEFWPPRGDEATPNNTTGSVLEVSLGQALLFRGDCVHAGGFHCGRCPECSKCLRLHVHIHLPKGPVHDPLLTTCHKDSHGKRHSDTHKSSVLHRQLANEPLRQAKREKITTKK